MGVGDGEVGGRGWRWLEGDGGGGGEKIGMGEDGDGALLLWVQSPVFLSFSTGDGTQVLTQNWLAAHGL